MPQPLTLSRAAKLAGVTRSQLQETLRDSGVNMFEGKIAVGDLLSLYPEIDLDRDPVFERIERIKRFCTSSQAISALTDELATLESDIASQEQLLGILDGIRAWHRVELAKATVAKLDERSQQFATTEGGSKNSL